MPFRMMLHTSEMLVAMIPYREPPSSKARAHLDFSDNCSNNQAFASSLSIFSNSFSLATNFFFLLNLAQRIQPSDNFHALFLLPTVCGKIMRTPLVYKWRVPLKMFFYTVKQTTVMVQNYANGSIWTKQLLSDKAKKPWPAHVVLTLDKAQTQEAGVDFL
jgi:hypothetical protein